MAISLMIQDETLAGAKNDALSLDFLNETITAQELIRERVYEEVRQYNATKPEYFRGLVQPTNAEATLNGYRLDGPQPNGRHLMERRQVDWQAQYNRAIEAFHRNGFFILVDDRQVESLDETIALTPQTQVSFVKLVPLVGG